MRFQFAPQSRPLPGFVITRGIQRGGFGEVYEGVSTGGKRVALKLLQHGTETELRGVRQCLNLSHPNLVTIFDILHDQDANSWIVMEYIDGITLDDVIAAHPRGLPHDEVAEWFTGIAAGLEYLHSRGLIHRDLKPANIYRTHGVVKIGDVGLSKLIDRVEALHTQTIGTVHYMAPEVSHGRYGPHVDLYSLGIILYELLTGRVPFAGESTGEVLMRHLTHLPDVSSQPEPIRQVLAKALAKDPSDRYSSLAEFRDAVLLALGSSSLPVPSPGGRNGSQPAHGLPMHPAAYQRNQPLMPTAAPPAQLTDFVPEDRHAISRQRFRRHEAQGALSKSDAHTRLVHRVVNHVPGGILGGWSQSITLVIGLSMGLAAALSVGLPPFVESSPWRNSTGMGLLAAQSAISVIALQSLFWWSRRSGGPARLTTTMMALAGGLVGAGGFLLTNYLLADGLIAAPTHSAMFRKLGAQSFMLEGGVPSWLAWSLYFAGLFVLGGWSRSGSLVRNHRFSPFSTLYAAGLGWLLSIFIWFPPVWGSLMAAWISCVLQLSTPALHEDSQTTRHPDELAV